MSGAGSKPGWWTRRWTGDRSSYPAMLMDYHFGQIAMAQGRIEEAAAAYQRGLKSAKERFLLDPRLDDPRGGARV